MPARSDLHKLLILGSGPIQIGQAAEFDYSGTQALKALRRLGYRIALINPNPATIMTDPDLADSTYLEPLTADFVRLVIAKERPDALLPTLGGQTALNLAMELDRDGTLAHFGVELVGAKADAIDKGEDRARFQEAMHGIGQKTPRGELVHGTDQARGALERFGLPAVIRPSFTLGGTGGGIAHTEAEFWRIVEQGLQSSPVHSVLIEESVLGWKEFELEVMRDLADTVVVITAIENVDPMGVHTGDSITVAPSQTLSDVEYQRMRDAAIAIIREIGVETGGSNIQFAVDPSDGRTLVIEMNPRVSRSSALASKATGFPIAKIAALLAVGFRLDELPNDITRVTPAAFEPTIDYVVTKIPRFAFEKFPGAEPWLGTQMRSVGEVMAIGRSFKESFQKALRSLESDVRLGLAELNDRELGELLRPNPRRIQAVLEGLRRGWGVDLLRGATGIDPWFLWQLAELVGAEAEIRASGDPAAWSAAIWREVKAMGFSDQAIAELTGSDPTAIRSLRKSQGVRPVYKTVDTCAAEFEAYTPYHYSSYDLEDEVAEAERPRVLILGSGPNRIGQGVEFDYATVHAVWALSELGYETVMVNSNPETVSTDYDTADRFYFAPLTFEDVLNVVEREQPVGVLVQLGGQTPLKLAGPLSQAGAPLWGTPATAIDRAEDRAAFHALCGELGLRQPAGAVAKTPEEALTLAGQLGYPLMVRPSYVLGGRAMQVVGSPSQLQSYLTSVYKNLAGQPSLLLDRFLENATEIDVDCLCDGRRALIAGVMEHIEAAGVHSGDSACVLPPVSLSAALLAEIEASTVRLALALGVKGLLNVQYAVQSGQLYILEANPRASRTVPFVSKAVGWPLAKYAARIAAGQSLDDLGLHSPPAPKHYSVKEVHLPFLKFAGVAPQLGPEMRSTGESMGIDALAELAYYRAALGAGQRLPRSGTAWLVGAGLEEVAGDLRKAGLEVSEGEPADAAGALPELLIDLTASSLLRRALEGGVPIVTTKEAARWTARAILAASRCDLQVTPLQEWLS